MFNHIIFLIKEPWKTYTVKHQNQEITEMTTVAAEAATEVEEATEAEEEAETEVATEAASVGDNHNFSMPTMLIVSTEVNFNFSNFYFCAIRQ